MRLRCPVGGRGPRRLGVAPHSDTNACARCHAQPLSKTDGVWTPGRPLPVTQLLCLRPGTPIPIQAGSPARSLLLILLPHFMPSPLPQPCPKEQGRGPSSHPHPLADRWEKQEGAAGPGHLSPPGQSGPHGPALGGAQGSHQRSEQLWGLEERGSKVKPPFQARPFLHGHPSLCPLRDSTRARFKERHWKSEVVCAIPPASM